MTEPIINTYSNKVYAYGINELIEKNGVISGTVICKAGIVTVHYQKLGTGFDDCLAVFRFVDRGELFTRTIKGKMFMRRALITQAKKFIMENLTLDLPTFNCKENN